MPVLLNYMSMYVLFEWFEVTSIELFLFAFIYSSLLTAYLLKKIFVNRNICMKYFSTLLDVMNHARLMIIQKRHFFFFEKNPRKNWHIVQQRKS